MPDEGCATLGPGPVGTIGFLDGRLPLSSRAGGHRPGTDAALLVAAARFRRAARIIDLGAGIGTVGLGLALLDPAAEVGLAERDAADLALAAMNADAAGLGARARTIAVDLIGTSFAQALAVLGGAASADLVVTNPPFFAAARVRRTPDADKARAHLMPEGGLARWLGLAAELLAGHGDLVLIHRTDALPEILAVLAGRLGAVRVRPVHPRAGAPAIRVLVRATKGSRAPFSLLPGLVLHAADGGFTDQVTAIQKGDAALDW
jgi:tRNA1(Val) A37 N6-methylase TrmN6